MRRAVLVAAVVFATLAPTARAAAPAPSTGTTATRVDLARTKLVDRRGRPLDGSGSSIAVVDTGVDPFHPAFRLPGGGSKVVALLSAEPCIVFGEASSYTDEVSSDPACVVRVPLVNADTGHGGHGSMVSGIAVGNHYVLPDGTRVGGAAPGARLVVISTTVALIGIENAFSWILAHHNAPCGEGVPKAACPPIRAVNGSWGATGPVMARLEAALAKAGVVVVWANGNGGGDGTTSQSNAAATVDHVPGVIGVASFDDHGRGTRDGTVSPTSSRGQANDPRTWPQLSAPGDNIISSCHPYQAICPAIETESPRDGPGPMDVATYFTGSGTSWSSPEVAGIVAVLFQVDPAATSARIEAALESTAYKFRDGAPYHRVGPYTSSYDKGTGLVDAYAAALSLGATVRGR